jgi:hypothetical protein
MDRKGVILIAMRSFTVRHMCSHMPHPTQRSTDTTSRCTLKSIASASVGHFDTQAWHPCPAVQSRWLTTATPIRMSSIAATGNNASVAQAAMQGTSSQRAHGIWSGKITGVPSACGTMASWGQALMQSPHWVQRSKNSASLTAPGGRSQSIRTGGAGFSGAASTWAAYSLAALATERTESLKKSRRPYLGSVAMVSISIFSRWSKGDLLTRPPRAARAAHSRVCST